MHTERLIARRILFADRKERRISRPVIRIATTAIALGCAVMTIAISVVAGFKQEIKSKLIGFQGQIQISRFDGNISQESAPFSADSSMLTQITAIPGIRHVQSYATKAGIIKHDDDIQGIVLKGVGSDYDWSYFKGNLVAGSIPNFLSSTASDEVVLSKSLAEKLRLRIGDRFNTYFIQQPPRARKFKVAGIYSTGFEEFDKVFVLCNLGQIRKLNDWSETQSGGIEISLDSDEQMEEVTTKVYESIGSDLNAQSAHELYPQLFDWLELQDINAVIIIALMLAVSGINMISALLVIMLERVRLIGTLKALGAMDSSIRKVFLWVAARILTRGMLIGTGLGVFLVVLQYFFHLAPLDESSYYISYVPVRLMPFEISLVLLGTFCTCLAMMLLPAVLIGKIRPTAAIKYD
ncbi:MAG: ABC transporter permease [Bacteroidota bacterium]